MARRVGMDKWALRFSILFAVGALAACDNGTASTTTTSGGTSGGGTSGGNTSGGGTTGSATSGGVTTGGTSGGTTTGGNAGFMAVNGCTMGTYTDQSTSATPAVEFPGTITGEYHFMPKCTHIHPGQTVTFNGRFADDPLNPGVAPSATGSDPSSTPNPITLTTLGTSATFTFPTAGTYGMYGGIHESLGLYGAIRVQ